MKRALTPEMLNRLSRQVSLLNLLNDIEIRGNSSGSFRWFSNFGMLNWVLCNKTEREIAKKTTGMWKRTM